MTDRIADLFATKPTFHGRRPRRLRDIIAAAWRRVVGERFVYSRKARDVARRMAEQEVEAND